MGIVRALCLGLCAPGILAAQSPAPTLVAEVANVRFHSDPLPNLHHVLYAAAWARRNAGPRSLAGPLPSPLDAQMTAAERAAWDAAVDYYDKRMASRHLLFDGGMVAIKNALVDGNLASRAIGGELQTALESALPIYRRYFWTGHDRTNRAWIAATTASMKTIAPEVIPRLEKLYGAKWFSTPVRADIVWVGLSQGAYETNNPPHATIAPVDTDWSSAETVFHEFSHTLVLSLQDRLARALGDRLREHGVLWHVVQFYLTGTAVQEVLKARGTTYTPLVYSYGLFDSVWSRYRVPIETSWAPYMQGTVTQDEAIGAMLKMLDGAK